MTKDPNDYSTRLTREEREFYDVWFREDCYRTGDYATKLSHSRGIGYNHYARMYPFYIETWKVLGMECWEEEAMAPLPENPEPPCPWTSWEEMEARLDELETGPLAHLTYTEMRDYMRQNPLPVVAAVTDEAHTAGRLKPDTVQTAMTDFRATHPYQ